MLDLDNKGFMFFWKLPISFTSLKEKLFLTDYVYVDKSTQKVIQHIQSIDPVIAHAVYPQYGIPSLGYHNRILCSDLNSIDFLQARKEMWESLGVLRLVKPLPMHIAGTIEIRDNDIADFETRWQKTYLNINTQNCSGAVSIYEENDLNLVQDLWKNLFKSSNKETRILRGVLSFLRTTLTEQIYYSETYFQKLFPILDLMMGNPTKHSQQLSITIGSWLQHVYENQARENNIDFTKILNNLWDSYRHYYLHQSMSLLPPSHLYTTTKTGECSYDGKDQKEDSRQGLYALHEIVRITLLTLLFLPKDEQEKFNSLPLVENHKSSKERKKSDSLRKIAFKSYFEDLIKKQIKPCKTFWIEEWHRAIFSYFS